jgi:hypothetical protein
VFDRWLPKLGGLKHVLWNVSQKKKLEDISWLGKLGSQTQLSLKCEGGVSAQITAEVFFCSKRPGHLA